ncbi:2',5'-phosphodiesterase 12 [Drosophila willistoni]|nr:2',5'-phosphodiesterase 12 [Drosophila willistoni]
MLTRIFKNLPLLRIQLNPKFVVCAAYSRSGHLKPSVDMEKVYLRNLKDSEDLHITFRFVNEELHVDRQFNFCRRINERIDIALTRIRSNIEKELQKRFKKKKNAEAQTEKRVEQEINIELYRDGCEDSVTDITFAELLHENPVGIRLRVMHKNFDILYNQPWITTLQVPSCVLADHLVYPTKLDLHFCSREHSKGLWYKAIMPASGALPTESMWELCGEGLIYRTTQQDVGHNLKLIVTPMNEEGLSGPPVEQITKCPVQPGPGTCPYELRQVVTPKPLEDPTEIRVVTYNLLADLYADSDHSRTVLFPYCPPKLLQIDYRKQIFIKELLGYNADLLCLQEVDQKIFEYDLKTVLGQSPHKFQGFMALKGDCAEGVAIFFRESRFELLATHVVNLGKNISTLPIFKDLWDKIKTNEKLAKRICERNTTLELCLLKVKNTDFYVLVANTHLYFHPDADHIRLLQIGFSIIYVEHIYKQYLKDYNISCPNKLGLLYCGDFNSVPECGIYKLMTEQFVDKHFIDWSSNAEEAVVDVELSQPFQMISACGTPETTNYTTLFSGCLDYIFYNGNSFDLLQSVPLPTHEQIVANEAIPSVCFPSDHVALAADLKFKSNSL